MDDEGRLHAAGTVRLERLGTKLGLVLEHEEVDTVGGLVLALLGRPPAAGDIVVYDGVGLKVVAVEGHGVEEVVAWCKPAAGVPY
jgi:CBS domain containing-hemolysin-like protein